MLHLLVSYPRLKIVGLFAQATTAGLPVSTKSLAPTRGILFRYFAISRVEAYVYAGVRETMG